MKPKLKREFKNKTYFRMGKFPVNYVLDNIIDNKDESDIAINGVNVYMSSQRYKLFKYKGIRCIKCGIVGEYFILEQHRQKSAYESKRFHFNLYGIDKNGKEMLMTKDHIIPKSKGGKNGLHNLQPMCMKCNNEKDDKMPKNSNGRKIRWKKQN